ncbi:universal stress protein [Halosimplex aquaticum]|uniref:Universal stress protein n=1 Tax=Halosimplex aquaticum TaxID=3026162 RepID=A0ABD5Y312_9EURY|nr:universal stress protein [Halosimplex aquaticum]
MDQPLVVYDDENTELLKEAGELAAGVDATLTIVSLMTADEFRDAREALDIVAQEEHTSYDDSVVIDAAKRQASETAEEVFDDGDVDWRVVGARIGDNESEADRILEVADDNDVDHVFITGKKRSPTGKAVFGDRAQAIILNFDGPVTSLLG